MNEGSALVMIASSHVTLDRRSRGKRHTDLGVRYEQTQAICIPLSLSKGLPSISAPLVPVVDPSIKSNASAPYI